MAKLVAKTCEELGLNMAEAMEGRLWLLLPEAHRTATTEPEFPFPRERSELMRICALPVEPGKKDAGSRYVRRARRAWLQGEIVTHKVDPFRLEQERLLGNLEHSTARARIQVLDLVKRVEGSVEMVHEQAAEASASLTELYDLCRRAIEGQMKAHLDGGTWRGEKITARAARDCFRIISGAVSKFGQPSAKDKAASKEINMQEAAEAIRSTREAVQLAPGAKEDNPQ